MIIRIPCAGDSVNRQGFQIIAFTCYITRTMPEDPLLSLLNNEQKKAVQHTEGPLLIIAGAGSGKTRALTHRIAYLIKHHGVKPQNILAVTFTNKAAGEMKERVARLLGGRKDASKPTLGTFHSICARILRWDGQLLGYKKRFVIYDEYDSLAAIKETMGQLHISQKDFNPRYFKSRISSAKNELVGPKEYEGQAVKITEQICAKVYIAYQERLFCASAFDFDDLIMKTVELFQKFPDVLKKYQKIFQYILIDEYQDTNHAQYMLAKLLARSHRNICVVGDDWQGIYSFRGATIQNILDFEKDYPEAEIIKLEQNYRSTKTIIDASNRIISENTQRTDKKLWTANGAGQKIILASVLDERKEGEFILKQITGQSVTGDDLVYDFTEEQLGNNELGSGILDTILAGQKRGGFRKSGRRSRQPGLSYQFWPDEICLKDHVVLYRTNAQSRALEETLLQYGVPYQIIGGVRFYERKEIKDVVAYLRVLVHSEDSVSVKRVINQPARGIGDRTWNALSDFANKQSLDLLKAASQAKQIPGLSVRAKQALTKFAGLIDDTKTKSKELKPSEVIDLVLKITGYAKMLRDGTEEGEARWENVLELKTVAKKFDNKKGPDGLSQFLEEVALLSEVDNLDESQDGLTMMTVHNAKGLEFPCVFMAGMEEGLFPHQGSYWSAQEMEEERRLAYVGITRAKEKLYLIHAVQRSMHGDTKVNAPSRFLDDIPENLVEEVEL